MDDSTRAEAVNILDKILARPMPAEALRRKLERRKQRDADDARRREERERSGRSRPADAPSRPTSATARTPRPSCRNCWPRRRPITPSPSRCTWAVRRSCARGRS